MKYITKLGVLIGLLGCTSGLIFSTLNKVNCGQWDIPCFIGGIVICLVIMNWRGFLSFLDERFEIEYTKDKGLSLKESKNDCKKNSNH